MDMSLLATKLRIPPQPHHLLRRSRLLDALEREIPQVKLTLVAAPAGYGKTTLLAQWANSSRLSVAWLSISEEDNDLERFLRNLLTAWEQAQPALRESPSGLLLDAVFAGSEADLAAFINAANEIPDHTVFVVDDYHLIDDPSIHQALTFLLDHLPPMLHLVLVGRAEPSLPLARYRARHELLEIRAEDLRFLPDEAGDFLNRLMGLDLTESELIPVQAQLEGWIAGLQLAALSLKRQLPGTDRLVISGKHRFIADYLSQDVLAHLPDDLQLFLLETSILDRLCGSLCDAVTARDDGQEVLERLERENLFLVPLDDHREWFRYHHLFADFLRGELNRRHADQVADLHRRAARWYLGRDLSEQAFNHAVEGRDVKLVTEIVDRYINAKLMSGELKVVKRWLDSLQAEWFAAYPVLGLARAGVLAFSGEYEACGRCVDEVEQKLIASETEDTRWQLARVTAVRCMMACVRNDVMQAETYAYQALQDLSDQDLGYRPGIYAALGDTYRQNGRWEEAKECYLKVLDFPRSPGVRVQSVHVFGAIADLNLKQGHLRQAAAYWRKALTTIQEQATWAKYSLPVAGWVYIRLGEILYTWNELPDAREHLSRGLERVELGGDVRSLIAGYLNAGRLELTEGNVEMAAQYLGRAAPLVETAQFPDWTSRFERFQLELWLAQGRMREAVARADDLIARGQLEEQPDSEAAQLAMARVFMVKGDVASLERAFMLLERLLQTAEAQGRIGVQIEALALRALCQWKRGERADAMTALEHSLRLAEPGGYVRLFADLHLPMARLLQEARSRNVMPEYINKLLSAFDTADVIPTSAEAALPEPLSPREQEILGYIAAGLTNREIAETLVISAETVKKHTGSIYSKLGVANRTEAAARARELDLLD
jgi:LuxR family maltose regulon positive regulatory protein